MKRSSSLQGFTEHKWLEHSEACLWGARGSVCDTGGVAGAGREHQAVSQQQGSQFVLETRFAHRSMCVNAMSYFLGGFYCVLWST